MPGGRALANLSNACINDRQPTDMNQTVVPTGDERREELIVKGN